MSGTGTQMTQELQEKSDAVGMYVTASIGGQICGIPVLQVHDVLRPQKITPIPLAPREVEGSLNLRGRIVTSVDLRLRMGLEPRSAEQDGMCIVVEQDGELYSLKVDEVGEVIKVSKDNFQASPATLDPNWRAFSEGVFRLESSLMVVLDVTSLLSFGGQAAAA